MTFATYTLLRSHLSLEREEALEMTREVRSRMPENTMSAIN